MRIALANLLALALLIGPSLPAMSAVVEQDCGCHHGAAMSEGDGAESADDDGPCCPTMKAQAERAKDRELTGVELPDSECCCSADAPQHPVATETTLAERNDPEADDTEPQPPATPTFVASPEPILWDGGRLRGPPPVHEANPRALSVSIHIQNCVYRA